MRLLEIWRLRAPLRIGRAHQADMIAVGIGDDGVAGTPERVPGRRHTLVAGLRQLRVCGVDGAAGREPETDHRIAACGVTTPTLVVNAGERRTVEMQREAVRQSEIDVMRSGPSPPDGGL